MRLFLAKGLTGLLVLGSVVAIAACGSSKSSSSNSSSTSGGSSSERQLGRQDDRHLLDLPLQGAVNVDTIPRSTGSSSRYS